MEHNSWIKECGVAAIAAALFYLMPGVAKALEPGLYAVTPVQLILRQHKGEIERFPHRPPSALEGTELTPHD